MSVVLGRQPRDLTQRLTQQIPGVAGVGSLGADAPLAPSLVQALNGPDAATILEWITWRDAPSPWCRWFNKAETGVLIAGASRQAITGFQLPPATLGVLRFHAYVVPNLNNSSGVTWALTVDDDPVNGFDTIIGPLGDISQPEPVVVFLRGPQVIKVVASSSLVANETVVARIMGWYWPMLGVPRGG